MRRPDTVRYARHSHWSDPGSYAHLLDALPVDPAALREIGGGLVLQSVRSRRQAAGEPWERSLRSANQRAGWRASRKGAVPAPSSSL